MHNPGRQPGLAFLVLAPLLGISRLLPPPQRAGEERRRRGWGGGDRRAVYGERPAKHTLRTGPPWTYALPGLMPREPPRLTIFTALS